MTEKEQVIPKPATSGLALSIVIPVYNGAASIAELAHALEELRIEGGHEIILVNDGSPDDSLDVCCALVDRASVPITLIKLARNFGEHNAVMAGLRHASGAHVITMDDDLQNPPEEIERLLAFAQGSGKEVVYTFYEDKQHPIWRNLGSRFANRVADFVLEKPRGLYLSSFRCMSAFVVREITRYEGPFPYVDGLILQVTHDIDRLMVRHLPRAVGRSNYNLRRLHAAVGEHVRQLFGDAAAGQHNNRVRPERNGGFGRRDGHRRGADFIPAGRLGFTDGGGAAAFRRTAGDTRHRGRISRPALPHGERKASICDQGGAAQPILARRRGASAGLATRDRRKMMSVYYTSLVAAILFGIGGQIALKSAAEKSATITAQFLNPLTIIGLAIYIMAALCYILALKKIPVSIAFPSVAASYAVVAVLAHILWNEPLGWPQLAGIALIGSGVLLIHQH